MVTDFYAAAYLQAHNDIHTMAPSMEEAILRNPLLEPLYLFNGVILPNIRNKFLERHLVRVDEIVDEGKKLIGAMELTLFYLPGHSINQIGLVEDKILYAADCYFAREKIEKHGILYELKVYLA